ncbi:SDR family oxidoreductase [bacterium]|nr:SDR family oxidoreductase [bacterium]
MKVDLKGETAVITGASRGIGREIALTLAKNGANIAVCARNEELLKTLVKEAEGFGVEAFYHVVDVRKREQQEEFFELIKERFGRIDICIPNAGRAALAKPGEITQEEWELDIDTNLTGLFITSQLALNIMKPQKEGYIFPIISKAATKSFLLRPSYCAAKAGALAFTRSLSLEAKEFGIIITSILPASVATDFQKGNPAGTDWMLLPSDVADMVLWLLSLSSRAAVDEIVLQNKGRKK